MQRVLRLACAVLAFILVAPPFPPAGAEVTPPLDTNNGSAPGDGILETLYGFEWIIEPGDNVTYSDVTITLSGGLSVLPGGRLNLHHVLLVANATGITMRVDPTGVLDIIDSRVDAGPLTNGAPEGTLQFSFVAEAGAALVARNSSFAHVGRPTGSAKDFGLYIGSANTSLEDVAVSGCLNGLVLDDATGVRATNVSVQDSAGADLLLLGVSSLDFVGGSFSTTNLSGTSRVNISYFMDAMMNDSTGRPIPGMELHVQSAGLEVYKTQAYGGSDPPTAVLASGAHAPRWIPVPAWMREGNLTPAPLPVEVFASYAEWSEHRTLVLPSNTALTFTKRLQAPANFTEGAAAGGVDDPGRARPNFAAGPSAAWADIDRDGDSDLYVAGGATGGGPGGARPPNHLYRNDGAGSFTDVTLASNTSYLGSAAASFADFDNDGYPDLYLLNFGSSATLGSPGEPNVLLRNTGDGTFEDVTQRAGVAGLAHSVAAAWADFDRDGYLDLFVANRGLSLNGSLRPEASALYRNHGDGTFSDVTAASGLAGPGASTCALWFDFDNDGWMDLLVGRDTGISPLFRSNRDGTFTDMTAASGLALPGSSGALAARDVDSNGWQDVFSAEAGPDRLWMNDRGNFTDEAALRGVDSALAGTGALFADLDADGDADLLVTNGRADAPKAFASPQLFRNDGTGHFADASAESGFARPMTDTPASALAAADSDCGPLYLAVPSGPNLLFACAPPVSAPAPVAVSLRGTVSNRDAVGARVTLRAADGFVAWTEVTGGASSTASRPAQVHLSIGAHAPLANLTVTWPSGLSQTEAGPIPARIVLIEPATVVLSAGPDRTVMEGVPTNFSAVVTASNDPDFAAHAVFSWAVSSANTSIMLSGRNTSFTFPAFGAWSVRLTATDSSTGLSANASATITVRDDTPPSVHILDPADGAAFTFGATLHLAASASDNDPEFASSASFVWHVQGPASNATLAGATASLPLNATGAYTVTLTVSDGAQNSASRTLHFTVAPPPCAPCGAADYTVPLALLGALIGAAAVLTIRRFYRKPPPPPPKE